jgi:hypothetical protein
METVPTAKFKALTGFCHPGVDSLKFKPLARRVAVDSHRQGIKNRNKLFSQFSG